MIMKYQRLLRKIFTVSRFHISRAIRIVENVLSTNHRGLESFGVVRSLPSRVPVPNHCDFVTLDDVVPHALEQHLDCRVAEAGELTVSESRVLQTSDAKLLVQHSVCNK
jgi:hypothetical protein